MMLAQFHLERGNVSLNNKLIDTLGFTPFDPWPLNEQFPTDPKLASERVKINLSNSLVFIVIRPGGNITIEYVK